MASSWGAAMAVCFSLLPNWLNRSWSIAKSHNLRDLFGHPRLCEGTSTAGQIDAAWSARIDEEEDLNGWLRENIDKLPVAKEQVGEILQGRHTYVIDLKRGFFPSMNSYLLSWGSETPSSTGLGGAGS